MPDARPLRMDSRLTGPFEGPSPRHEDIMVSVPENFPDCLRAIADFLDLGDKAIFQLTGYLPGSSVQEDLDRWIVVFEDALLNKRALRDAYGTIYGYMNDNGKYGED